MGAERKEGLTLPGSCQGGFTEEVTLRWCLKDAQKGILTRHGWSEDSDVECSLDRENV